MKKRILKLTFSIAAAILLTVALAVAVGAEIYTGECGSNVTYTLDTETGELEISGTGAMTNYSYDSYAPWYSYSSYVKTIKIGDSVTSIGYRAFYGCSSLTSVVIPDSVTSIGGAAFDGCSRLTSIEIPDSVTSIGSYAFSDTALYNDSSNWVNGVLYIGNHCINAKRNISNSYAIKEGTLTIADYAFQYCSSLTSVEIPDSVTSIGDRAFYYCISLTSVEIPDSVTSIGSYAFEDCSSLESVVIGDSVTSIGSYAFYNCSSLTSVEIPDSVTSIGY